MTPWSEVSLAEVATAIDYGLNAGASAGAVGPRLLRITDIQMDSVDWSRVPRCAQPFDTAKALKPGDIVFARTGATTGKSYLVRSCPDDAVFASYLIRVRLNDTSEPRFVSHFFGTPRYWSQISQSARGVAQPGVNATVLGGLRLPSPPLPEQRRLADILDRADALRTKRRAALALLDTLTQSIFVEMFGDPLSNPMSWPLGTLGDVVTSVSDGPHVSPAYAHQGVPFLSTRHIRRGEIVWEDLKYLSDEDAAFQWRKCQPARGDVLYTKGGTTGLAARVQDDRPFAVWVHVAILKPDVGKIDSTWLESMLNSDHCYRQSQVLTHGIANRDLGLKRMVRIRIYIPPLELQREFARRVAAVDKLKAAHRASLAQLDSLFASLQHRAFRGEL